MKLYVNPPKVIFVNLARRFRVLLKKILTSINSSPSLYSTWYTTTKGVDNDFLKKGVPLKVRHPHILNKNLKIVQQFKTF